MRKYLPIIVGLFLGAASILIGQIPNGIRQFTGLTIIGNQVGYLLGALAIAWVNSQSWSKGFLQSSFMLAVANLTYYSFVFAFNQFIMQTESHISNLVGLIKWLIISVVISALAAAAVWIASNAKSKLLNYGIFAIVYFGMLGVIYLFNVRFVISWYHASTAGGFFQTWRFAGYVFEIVFAAAITTVVLAVGLKH